MLQKTIYMPVEQPECISKPSQDLIIALSNLERGTWNGFEMHPTAFRMCTVKYLATCLPKREQTLAYPFIAHHNLKHPFVVIFQG